MSVDHMDTRVLWPYNNGNWDALWERDTEFDDLFLQFGNGSFSGPANAGGTHSHSSASDHTHTSPAHRHLVSAGSAVNTFASNIDEDLGFPPPVHASPRYHTHSAAYSNYSLITLSDEEVTTQVVTADVEYLRCVVLKPKKVQADIPIDGMLFGDSATAPNGYSEVNGAYEGLFIRGAVDGSYGSGTSAYDTHGHTADDHLHQPTDHGHAQALCGFASPPLGASSGGLPFRGTQHHNVTLMTSSAVPDTDNEAVTVVDATYTPAFIKLLGLYNNSGKPVTPVGVCVGFIGAIGNIPSNWSAVEAAYDYQPRVTLVNGNVGDTGGDDDHTHTVTDHDHGWTVHLHSLSLSWTGGIAASSGSAAALSSAGWPADAHKHRWTIEEVEPSINNASVTLDSVDGRPPYRTLLLIKKDSLNCKDVSLGTHYGTEDLVMAA